MTMQQTKSYWRLVAMAGVMGAFAISACVVTTSTDDNTAGSGGVSNTGGTSTGGSAGSSVAGTAGTGGAAVGGSGGAAAGSGGAAAGSGGGSAFACDMGAAGAPTGTPAANCNAATGNTCAACMQTSCCSEVEACNGSNPGNVCQFGGPKGEGEFACIQTCMKAAFKANGGSITPSDFETCASGCVTPSCDMTLGSATNELAGCVNDSCADKCFQ